MLKKFSILITTKNRKDDLAFTLIKIQHLLTRNDVECVVFDDGSTDETSTFIKENYPDIILFQNEFSKGLIHCRNQMLNKTSASYAISLDDDAHFLSEKVLENIEDYFISNPKCGVIACRIFWGLELPQNTFSKEKSERTRGFVGCGHVWNMKAWRDIPNYPEWFVFYGEEDFASYQLFKKKWEVHYLPEILVNHRVEVKSRRKDKDYSVRLRRSLRSGWYLYFLFLPISIIPKRFAYSVWMQLKLKVFKGDFKALKALVLALFDLVFSIPKIIKNANRFSLKEYQEYQELEETKIYWKPVIKNES
ncbi:glycosyltransferase family 2 protein [Flavobacterium daemonense]|uniref:glycosyltransferase family 2 protein n=1 Tax=Flavobacterium daemonense TaxID=1393049 RepID=UPI001185B0F3|nr:glycosyltransferase [Flavobacterium daemonense]KAF2333117.1 glycosyltransferase family 2 protein [Flavobacterium daemonense]